MTQTNKPEWWTIFLKHFLNQPVFLKHFFETKTSPIFPLFLSEHAMFSESRGGIIICILFLNLARFAITEESKAVLVID